MATTKDWTSLNPNVSTQYFAGGDLTDWCVHTVSDWVRVVEIYNRGTGALYVSCPGLTSTAAVTDACILIPAGNARSLYIGDRSKPSITTFSTWGADGAAHAMDVKLEGAY